MQCLSRRGARLSSRGPHLRTRVWSGWQRGCKRLRRLLKCRCGDVVGFRGRFPLVTGCKRLCRLLNEGPNRVVGLRGRFRHPSTAQLTSCTVPVTRRWCRRGFAGGDPRGRCGGRTPRPCAPGSSAGRPPGPRRSGVRSSREAAATISRASSHAACHARNTSSTVPSRPSGSPSRAPSGSASDEYGRSSARPRKTMPNQLCSTSVRCRTSPNRLRSDGGTACWRNCSSLRPAHFFASVSRWKSSQVTSVVRSSAAIGGKVRAIAPVCPTWQLSFQSAGVFRGAGVLREPRAVPAVQSAKSFAVSSPESGPVLELDSASDGASGHPG